MVKVALDATPLTVSTGGVARYTAELSRALALGFVEDEFWLVSDQRFPIDTARPSNLKTGKVPRNFFERRWWACGLPRELSRLCVDVFHGTDFSVPYLPSRPSVMTLHDLSVWLDPRWHIDAARIRRRTPLLLRMGLATMIITPSEAIRRESIARFHLNADRVVAVPLAAGSQFRPVEAPPPERPYFLYAGTLEPRKNIGTLLQAWRGLRAAHPSVDLVLAGRRRSDFAELPAEPGLRVLGVVNEVGLPALYSGALAFVYPSWYEGFGLPVLEAMQCGTPVIASSDPAIAEVAGSAARLVDPRDPRALSEALRTAVEEPDWRTGMRARGLQRSAEFSWERTASLTREVYAEAIARFRAKS